MPATIKREADNIYVLRLSGTVLKEEINDVQNAISADINAGVGPRVLTLLDRFEGFERYAEWGDLAFLQSHSHDIAKIAIVGDAQWKENTMAFAGAGNRKAPVKFFSPSQDGEARAWLAE